MSEFTFQTNWIWELVLVEFQSPVTWCFRSLSNVFPHFRPLSTPCACSVEDCGSRLHNLPTNHARESFHILHQGGVDLSVAFLSFSFSSAISWIGRVVPSRVKCKSSKNNCKAFVRGCKTTWACPFHSATVWLDLRVCERAAQQIT